MINRIVVFNGSKKDFKRVIKEQISGDEKTLSFMQLIQMLDDRLKSDDSGSGRTELSRDIEIDNCIVGMDDFGSVKEHVLTNFVNIVGSEHDIKTLYVHNPPKRVINSLESYSENIEYLKSDYKELNRDNLEEIYNNLNNDVLGQDKCKKKVISGLYKLIVKKSSKPIVLMLYGPSGVGKTETAKSVSRTLGGELLRVQFSMMQTPEAYNYVFGAEHSKGSFARDMLGRESNVILIDEFDKVSPTFYNAFYELFDEGKYVDSNYDVDLSNTIFICTSNYHSEDEIKNNLGPAMFSRIDTCIEYSYLAKSDKTKIINSWYEQIISQLNEEEKNIIHQTDVLKCFIDNAEKYNNIRSLKTKMENAIFDILSERIILEEI